MKFENDYMFDKAFELTKIAIENGLFDDYTQSESKAKATYAYLSTLYSEFTAE